MSHIGHHGLEGLRRSVAETSHGDDTDCYLMVNPIAPVPVILSGGPNHLITNLDIPLANNEYPFTCQDHLKQIMVKARDYCKIQWAFISGDTTINYMTIWPGGNLVLDGIDFTNTMIYFNCSKATTLEILELY